MQSEVTSKQLDEPQLKFTHAHTHTEVTVNSHCCVSGVQITESPKRCAGALCCLWHSGHSGLLTDGKWFNFLAEQSSENVSLYDGEELENLLTHFLCHLSAQEAQSEFTVLKKPMVSSDLCASLSFLQVAQTVLHEHSGVFTEREKLIHIAVVIPV